MKKQTILMAMLVSFMALALTACSSDDDQPKSPDPSESTETKHISAADFDSKVKGRMWVREKLSTVMSDGTEYDKLIANYMVGDSGIEMEGLSISGDVMTYFWIPPTYRPGIKFYSREDIGYSYDELTGELTANTRIARKCTYTVLSVSEDELILGAFYGVTPKDFNPERYDLYFGGEGGDMQINTDDMDPGSYVKFTMRAATAEEASELWNKYQENE